MANMNDDAAQIVSSMTNQEFVEPQYSETNWHYLQDINGGNYTNYIQFMTTSLVKQWIDLQTAYLQLCFSLTSSGAPYTTIQQVQLALKEGVVSLIAGVNVASDQSKSIISETGPYNTLLNAIRLRLENNFDFQYYEGAKLGYAIDNYVTNNAFYATAKNAGTIQVVTNGTVFTSIGGVNASLTVTNTALGTLYNGESFFVTVTGAGSANVSIGGVSQAASSTGGVGGTGLYYAVGYTQTGSSVTFPVIVNGTNWISIGGVPVATAGTFNAVVSTNSTTAVNKGFMDRITFFQSNQNSSITSGVFSTIVTIPLRLIHDIFLQLNFPIISLGLNLQFYLAQTEGNGISNTPILPFMCDATTPYPKISYGTGGNNNSGQNGQRLYYRTVKYNARDAQIMAARLREGFTKTVKFISADFSNGNLVGTISGTVNNQNLVVAQAVVRPLRLWMLFIQQNVGANPQSTIAGSTSASLIDTQGCLQSPYLPSAAYGCPISQVMVKLNSINYFDANLEGDNDLNEQLQEQFNLASGSLLRFQDWDQNLKNNNSLAAAYGVGQNTGWTTPYCMDLTHLASRLEVPLDPVNITVQFTMNGNSVSQYNVVFIIEKQNQLSITFSDSVCSFVVGNTA